MSGIRLSSKRAARTADKARFYRTCFQNMLLNSPTITRVASGCVRSLSNHQTKGNTEGLWPPLLPASCANNNSLFRSGVLLVGLSAGLGILQMTEQESIVGCEGKGPQDRPSSQQLLSEEKTPNLTTTSDRVCGKWCAHAATPADTPCIMNKKIIPCRGEWCRTTAGRWSLYAMGSMKKKRVVPCELYSAGVGYPIGGIPCDPACLIDEIKTERHPAPTGYGLLCKPGTCIPASSSRSKCGEGLGLLQCPVSIIRCIHYSRALQLLRVHLEI
jgi:hypothetical protein